MRKLVPIILIAFCLLYSCGGDATFSPVVQGGGCTFPAIANKLLGKVWIGQLDCAGMKRTLRLTFSQSGCNVLVNGQALIYNGAQSISFAGFGEGTFDPTTGAFTPAATPVTINGSQAVFTMMIQATNPSGNLTTVPRGGVLIVPGTEFEITVTVTIGDASLSGTYSLPANRPDEGQLLGSICFAPETVPTADVSGHWTGTMTGTMNGTIGPGTIDATLSMSGNVVNLASQGTFTDSMATVQLNPPIGVFGIVIGNQVLIGVTYIRQPGAEGSQDHIEHRWLFGTITGNTITGEFSDIINPTGSGTFTLTRSTQAARHAAAAAITKH